MTDPLHPQRVEYQPGRGLPGRWLWPGNISVVLCRFHDQRLQRLGLLTVEDLDT